jgi:hypothetical protein
MKITLFILVALVPFTLSAKAAEYKCSDAKIRELLHHADKISSVDYKSNKVQAEIKAAQTELQNCEEQDEPGMFYSTKTKLYCRGQYEDQHSAVGCEDAGFDGGSLMHFKNNDNNSEKLESDENLPEH